MKRLSVGLILAVLLLLLSTAMLNPPAFSSAGNPTGHHFLPAAYQPEASLQTCYTIDTSRPEWLSRFIHLPVVLRSHTD